MLAARCALLLLTLAGQASAVKHLRNATSLLQARQSSRLKAPNCGCQAGSSSWKKSARTVPKCVFIDLGAAGGNTLETWLQDGYGPVSHCPHGGDWEAFLVEANPQFTSKLQAVQRNLGGKVHSMASTAAYTCDGTTTFSIDPDVAHDHWGSSMEHSFIGSKQYTVPTVNVNKLIAENTIPQDWVVLKVDIEGAEYEVIPCLAESDSAKLIDDLFVEEHWWFSETTAAKKLALKTARETLKSKGVRVPFYFTQT
eukprot:TRINITY_DN6247_c0_g2_i1.p1 TRINITY_DN6247_c0_g2~~TRINITY_DN6247_c0_g2_i1.p1  ORF type:complete len:272 (+),score=60.76 TRINITY_DN6247_c0_g2_i1:55-816(+)